MTLSVFCANGLNTETESYFKKTVARTAPFEN